MKYLYALLSCYLLYDYLSMHVLSTRVRLQLVNTGLHSWPVTQFELDTNTWRPQSFCQNIILPERYGVLVTS